MKRQIDIHLSCCGQETEVQFSRADAPGFPAGLYRTNLICEACGTLLILTLRDDGNTQAVEQEKIEF